PIRFNHALPAPWGVNQEPGGRKPPPPRVPAEFLTGSTDLRNPRYPTPANHPAIAVFEPTLALPPPALAGAAGGPAGDLAVRDGAVGLALTAVDYLADPALREAVHAEFAAAGGPLDVPTYFD